MIRYFQALLCFYTQIFQTSSNQGVLKLLCNCHLNCEMAKNHRRIPEEKVFVTRELSKEVTTLTLAQVI